jgi:hypothetical protein
MKYFAVYEIESDKLYYEGPAMNEKSALMMAIRNFKKINKRSPGWDDNFFCIEQTKKPLVVARVAVSTY